MTMRPIDADQLRKKAVPHTKGNHGYSADVKKWAVLVGDLDDAPTLNLSPCDFCKYNPQSSCDGKPCTMCPATTNVGGDINE